MKILIVGYGRMGREIESIILNRGHQVAGRVDPYAPEAQFKELSPEALVGADAAIEFSLAEGVRGNVEMYLAAGVPAVVATTGWDSQREEIHQRVEATAVPVLWGYNFSPGAHMLFDLSKRLSAFLNELPDYDIMVTEYHHKKKVDSPSGTALTLAESILEPSTRKKRIETGRVDGAIADDTLHVASVRGGHIPGIHSPLADGPADSLEIRHTARSRQGFALGSVMAAEWIQGKRGFLDVKDFMHEWMDKALEGVQS